MRSEGLDAGRPFSIVILHRKKRLRSVGLAIVLVATFLWSSETIAVRASSFEAHTPISIRSNADFTPANGVVGGSGTAKDPFVIERWNITSRGENPIDIRGTNAHFVIRNVYLSTFGDGIHVENAVNGRIEASEVRHATNGVYFFATSSMTVLRNNFTYNHNGVHIKNSNTISIVGNTILASRQFGIFLLVIGNVNVTENNIFWSAATGISLSTPFGDPVLVFHNNLVRNSLQAYDGSVQTWDDGYPSGGNYWSDYSGVDNCSGPSQDICSSPDGIGDDWYRSISFSGTDHYPLMKPFGIMPDTVPPVWVGGSSLRASPGLSPSVIILSWTPSTDEVGIVRYRVYQGTSLVATVHGSLVGEAIGNLSPNTRYSFKVEAGDVWDNWSTNGPSVEATAPPPPGLYYNLLYTRPAYQGGTTVLVNWFNNTTTAKLRVVSVSVVLDFGTYSWSAPVPCSICESTQTINLNPGEKRLMNLTARIPSTASVGNHTLSANVNFQYFYYGDFAYWVDGDPIVGQGSMVIESVSPPSISRPFSILNGLIERAREVLAGPLLATLIGLYVPLVASACYLVVRDDRKRQRRLAKQRPGS